MLGVTECALAFADPDRAIASRPTIDVLEQMAMKSAVVANAETSRGERLIRPLRRHHSFKLLQRSCVANPRNVLEDCRTAITIGLGDSSVGHSDQCAPVPYFSFSK